VVQDGTGKAPELAREFVGKSPFLLTYGDILVRPETYPQMIRRFEEGKNARPHPDPLPRGEGESARAFSGVITVTPGQDVMKGGLNFFDEAFCLKRVVEKPSTQQLEQLRREGWLKPGDKVWYNAGIYIFTPEVFEFTAKLQKSPRGEYELTDAVNGMLAAKHRLAGLEIEGRWVDVRDPGVLAELERGEPKKKSYFLDQILADTKREIEAAKANFTLADVKRMVSDAPPVRSFSSSLREGFGIIAEVKRRSPSAGEMPAKNFEVAPATYAKSPIVKGVSVLTNATHFGMSVKELQRVRSLVPQPVLRKDFLVEEYQVYEARAFGADAVLLMANVLGRDEMKRLFALARELGMDVLFEAHTKEEVEAIPQGAEIIGVNSRKFKASGDSFVAKMVDGKDLSVEFDTFSLIKYLPQNVIKVAESGVNPDGIAGVANMGYDVVLVGTSLLKASNGIEKMLQEFEGAVREATKNREVKTGRAEG
jgi:indole-3-glycerol phosphate synthase